MSSITIQTQSAVYSYCLVEMDFVGNLDMVNASAAYFDRDARLTLGSALECEAFYGNPAITEEVKATVITRLIARAWTALEEHEEERHNEYRAQFDVSRPEYSTYQNAN